MGGFGLITFYVAGTNLIMCLPVLMEVVNFQNLCKLISELQMWSMQVLFYYRLLYKVIA